MNSTNNLTPLQCQKSFASKKTINRHKLIHDDVTPFQCLSCKKRFIQKCQLDAHQSYHRPENLLICDYCQKGFNGKLRLKVHIRVNHLNTMRFECKTCQKTFSDNNNLKKHEELHDKQRMFFCHYYEQSNIEIIIG